MVSRYWTNNRAAFFEFNSSNSPAEEFYKVQHIKYMHNIKLNCKPQIAEMLCYCGHQVSYLEYLQHSTHRKE